MTPDAFAVYQSREELRIRGYRDFMAMLADALPSHVDADRAADILITMTSPCSSTWRSVTIAAGHTRRQSTG